MLLRRHHRRDVRRKEPYDKPTPKVETKPKRDLEKFTVLELREMAKEEDIEGYYKFNKSELIENLKE